MYFEMIFKLECTCCDVPNVASHTLSPNCSYVTIILLKIKYTQTCYHGEEYFMLHNYGDTPKIFIN